MEIVSDILPKQRVSESEKQKASWYKPTIDYYIALAKSLHDKDLVRSQIDAANGEISGETYSKLLSSLVPTDNDAFLNLPNELREVDFISSIIEKHMGEYIELPYEFQVKPANEEALLSYDVKARNQLFQFAQEAFFQLVSQLQQQAAQQNQSPEDIQIPDFKDFLETKSKEFLEEHSRKAKDILNLINSDTDFNTMRVQLFYDWLTTEQFYTHRYIANGKLVKESVSPLHGYPVLDDNDNFVEDGFAFLISDRISYHKFIEESSGVLSNDDILEVKEYISSRTGTQIFRSSDVRLITDAFKEEFYSPDNYSNLEKAKDSQLGDDLTIERNILYFVSEKEIRIRTYIDFHTGIIQEEVVDKDYKFDVNQGDLSVEKEWIQQVYVGRRYGSEDEGVYIKPQINVFQRYDHNGFVKLPVGGKMGILRNKYINPIPQRLLPYLAYDRLLLVAQQRTLAKYKGSVFMIPKSIMKDDKGGSARQKYLYMKLDGTIIYDDSEVDFNTIAQGVRTIQDPDTIHWLTTLIDLRRVNREDAFEEANMNKDRNAQIDTRAVKGNVEQNIYRAKLGSALSVFQFNKALERDHMADLEASKIAFVDGYTGSYFDDETGNVHTVNIKGEEFINNTYHIKISNSKMDYDKLNEVKEFLGFSAAQGGDYDISVEAILNNNIGSIKEKVNFLVDKKRQYEESMQNKQLEIAQLTEQSKDKDRQKDILIAQIKEEGANYRKELDIRSELFNQDLNLNQIDDSKEVIESAKLSQKEKEIQLKERQQSHKESDDKEKNRLTEKKMAMDMKIAKENKNKYDVKQKSK